MLGTTQVIGAPQGGAAQGRVEGTPQGQASPTVAQGIQAAATALPGQVPQQAPGVDTDGNAEGEPLGPTRQVMPATSSDQVDRNLATLMADLEERVVSLAAELRHWKSTVEQLRTTTVGVESSIVTMAQDISRLQASSDRHQSSLDTLDARVRSLPSHSPSGHVEALPHPRSTFAGALHKAPVPSAPVPVVNVEATSGLPGANAHSLPQLGNAHSPSGVASATQAGIIRGASLEAPPPSQLPLPPTGPFMSVGDPLTPIPIGGQEVESALGPSAPGLLPEETMLTAFRTVVDYRYYRLVNSCLLYTSDAADD